MGKGTRFLAVLLACAALAGCSSGRGTLDFGSPGTDARGFTFDHEGGPAEAGWFGVDLTEQDGQWWHLESTDPVTRCIVHFEGEPIGLLQFYEYIEKWKPAIGLSPDQEAWGLDLYLGEVHLHGRGIGTRLVSGVAERLISDHGATRVLIDPHVGNTAAVRAYEKAGFRKVRLMPSYERVRGEWRDAWLMEFVGADE